MTSVAPRSWRRLAIAAALIPAAALAAVGKVSVLAGSATRTPKGAAAVALAQGSEIELGDMLATTANSNLKITLNDESSLLVGAESQLVIEEAKFEGLERRGFSAKLLLGKVWAKVTKAVSGSEAKFEVTTERAVAGVRGTVFRVDATKLLSAATTGPGGKAAPKSAAKAKPVSVTTVKVSEGKVAVEAMVKKMAAATPAAGPGGPAPTGAKKPRVQVAGPAEVSAAEWEKKFAELQANQAITIGEELWQQAEWKPDQDQDEFAAFIKQHGK